MITPSTERGLSEVLGAILMFALVFSLLVIVQVWAVPAANAQVELEHSQALESEFGELGESLDRVTLEGGAETSSLAAGVRYPSRIFLINPPPASYTFAASDTFAGGLSVANVVAVDGQTDDYFSTRPTAGTLAFDTRTYSLSTDYAQYAEPPVFHIEGGAVYKLFDNGEYAAIDNGNIVNGRTITLVALEGDVSTGGSGVLSLPMAARTGPMQTISITNQPGENIVISVPTTLDTADWEAILASEADSNGYVVDGTIDVTDGVLTFELVGGETYDLRLSKARIGQESVTPVTPAYITAPDDETNRRVTGASSFSVQVRDEFNNPVSGVDVTFTANIGTFEKAEEGNEGTVVVASNENGMATARYNPSEQDAVIKATIQGAASNEPDPKRVHFEVDYVDGRNTGDDGTNSLNPYTDNLVLVGTTTDGDRLKMTFVNKAEDSKTIVEGRIAFFYQATPGTADKPKPVTTRLSYDAATSNPMIIGRDLVPLQNRVVPPDGTIDVYVEFFTDAAGTDTYGTPNTDDFFVLNVLLFDDTTGTYFVQGTESGIALTDVTASNVGTDETEVQMLTFELGQPLGAGETITIDLSDAQSNNKLLYNDASVADNADGTVAIDQSGQSATITYTAAGTEAVTEVITITVSDIDGSGATSGDSYQVTFTGPGGQTVDTTFEAN